MKTTIEDMMLWYELHRLQERYVSVIDADRLEDWPDLFSRCARNCETYGTTSQRQPIFRPCAFTTCGTCSQLPR
jgi:hypothetical protein